TSPACARSSQRSAAEPASQAASGAAQPQPAFAPPAFQGAPLAQGHARDGVRDVVLERLEREVRSGRPAAREGTRLDVTVQRGAERAGRLLAYLELEEHERPGSKELAQDAQRGGFALLLDALEQATGTDRHGAPSGGRGEHGAQGPRVA